MIHHINASNGIGNFQVIYKGSVNLETPGTRGVSHLLEHLLCKGFEHLTHSFSSLSINWNAYTSMNEVVFYMTGLTEYVEKYRDEFLNGILEYKVTEEELEAEKKIVIAEIEGALSDPGSNLYLNALMGFYDNMGPLGSVKDIQNITLEQINEFKALAYDKPFAILDVSTDPFKGEVQFNRSDKLKLYQRSSQINPNHQYYQTEVNSQYKDVLVMGRDFDSKYSPAFDIARDLLSSGLESPLYQELREKRGLLYSLGIFDWKCGKNYIPFFSTNIHANALSETLDTFSEIMQDPERYINFDSFLRMKTKLKSSTTMKKRLELADTRGIINPQEKDYDEKLGAVKYDQVLEVVDIVFGGDPGELVAMTS